MQAACDPQFIKSVHGTVDRLCAFPKKREEPSWPIDYPRIAGSYRMSMSERFCTTWLSVASAAFVVTLLLPRMAGATTSAELYTSAADGYGRFEARLRFAGGDGVVSSFFLWKDGSEKTGTFWNELDFEKIGADCHLQTNALYGNPVGDHSQKASLTADLCNSYHVYAYEWLADSITWFVDGTQIRQETGDVARAYADNAPNGMQLHFNIWPGNASFGGNFNPSILPVHQYIDWVQFTPYANGAFAAVAWREDFGGQTLPSSFLTGNWASPKNLSTDDPSNVNFIDGYGVLSLTADNATGPAGAMPAGGGSGLGGAAAGASGSGGIAAGGTTQASGAGASGTANSTSSAGASATTNSMGGAPTDNGGSVNAAGGTPGSSGATTTSGTPGPAAQASPGCGCTQAGSTGSGRSGLPAGTLLLAVLVGAVNRRRRVQMTA